MRFVTHFLVNPCHLKFKADLNEALNGLICRKVESVLMVDDLVGKLYERFPGVAGFERAKILNTVSKLYGKKVEYMGKKKRYILYTPRILNLLYTVSETFKPSNVYIQDYTLQLCINIYDFSWLFYRAYYRGLGFCESTELETSGILLNYR